ncbi:MAG TPA: type II toxin-antitoxin system HipA family toxin [Steroidobacteraceae bacterium]|jgi:serine/threonine-protein kinase HipA|nr:type II toxin-antitoxin system HipA family toxin [Steroidobacteraceae bacterium]
MKTKELRISTPQGIAGDLLKEPRYVFNYTATERSEEISLTMPMRAESYSSGALLPIFEMNKPEGYLLSKIEEAFAKAGPLDDMSLLALTGGAQIGRLTYTSPDEPTRRARAPISRKELLTRKPTSELFEQLAAIYFESGISGVQPKVLVPETGSPSPVTDRATVVHSDLIVKASGIEFPHLTQNEFLCMSAAKRAGIPVPDFALSEDGGLFILSRFDQQEGKSLGFEDMGVLTGRGNRDKYQGSYENVAKAIRLYCESGDPLAQLQQFFDYVALMVMVRNGDGHLKNFGLLYQHPQNLASIRLAPLYDVVTTSIYDISGGTTQITKYDRTLALKLGKTRSYPNRKTLLEFGKTICQVMHPQRTIERCADAMSETLKTEGERVEPSLLKTLGAAWDEGRRSVEPDQVFTRPPVAG